MDYAAMQSAQNQAAVNYAVPQDRSRLSRVSEMTAALNGDLAGLKNILAEAHIAMTGHSGVTASANAGPAGLSPGPTPVTGLFTDIENWMAGAALHLEEIRRLAEQIHELVRR